MSKRFLVSLTCGLMLAVATLPAEAAPPPGNGRGARDYYDTRYGHDRYYPSRGGIVRQLPPGHFTVFDRANHRYYQHDGIWYAPRRTGFVVVGPPLGVTVSVLPPFYSTVWFGGIPYYYANDTYYVWRDRDRVYEVVDPPEATSASTTSAATGDVYVYPKNGQDSELIARDRYECHRWAVSETGFDPTQSGNVSEEQREAKRTDYRRAEAACLEGRGYTVK